jgi:hypothetical protein
VSKEFGCGLKNVFWQWPPNFPAVWRDPQTPLRERKRMLALVIEDVTVIKPRQITVAIRFRGGATTALTLPRPLTAQQLRATHDEHPAAHRRPARRLYRRAGRAHPERARPAHRRRGAL